MFCDSSARFYSLFTSSLFLYLSTLRAVLLSGFLLWTALVFALKWGGTETWSLISPVALCLCSPRATFCWMSAKWVSNPNLAVLLHMLQLSYFRPDITASVSNSLSLSSCTGLLSPFKDSFSCFKNLFGFWVMVFLVVWCLQNDVSAWR